MQGGFTDESHIATEGNPMKIPTPPQLKLWKWEDSGLTSSIGWRHHQFYVLYIKDILRNHN